MFPGSDLDYTKLAQPPTTVGKGTERPRSCSLRPLGPRCKSLINSVGAVVKEMFSLQTAVDKQPTSVFFYFFFHFSPGPVTRSLVILAELLSRSRHSLIQS